MTYAYYISNNAYTSKGDKMEQEFRTMTEAEMAMAKATGARVVTIRPALTGFRPDMTQEEFEEYLNQ